MVLKPGNLLFLNRSRKRGSRMLLCLPYDKPVVVFLKVLFKTG